MWYFFFKFVLDDKYLFFREFFYKIIRFDISFVLWCVIEYKKNFM